MSEREEYEAERRDMFVTLLILVIVSVISFVVGCKIGRRHGEGLTLSTMSTTVNHGQPS